MKKKKIRSIFTLIISSAILLSLAACGKTSSSSNNTGMSEKAESTPKEEKRWLRVHEDHYGTDGNLKTTTDWIYNEYGQPLEITKYEGEDVLSHSEYSYDENQIPNSLVLSDTSNFKNCVEKSEYTYTYDEYGIQQSSHEKGQRTYKPGEEGTDTSYEYDHVYYHDAEGELIGSLEFKPNDSFPKVGISFYYSEPECEYDDNGLLIKETIGKSYHEYEYDEHDNLIKDTHTANSGTENEWTTSTEYTYEEKVCKTVKEIKKPETEEKEVIGISTTTDAGGAFLYSNRYLYDNRGHLIGIADNEGTTNEYNEYNDDGLLIRTSSSGMIADITYDSSGKRIREDYREEIDGDIVMYGDCECDADGNLLRVTTHALDSFYEDADGLTYENEYKDGLLMTTRYYNPDGSLDDYEEYKYDSDGKILSLTYYNADGSINCIDTPAYASITVFK